jgi:hypothetical protein
MADEIGNVKSVMGTSMALNNQMGQGTQKPSAMGQASPGGTKPERAPCGPVPMPK